MALARIAILALAFAIVIIAVAVRYDAISVPLVNQLVAGSEFEWMLIAFLLAFIASALAPNVRH